MSPTEQHYAQIEKEALGITWASESFADYLIGLKFHIETDHKLLFPLLSTKNLDKLPARVQHFQMCMMRFSTISHVPGKNLYTDDTLTSVTIVIVTRRPLRHAMCSDPCGKIKSVLVASSSASYSLFKLTLHP